MALAQRTIVFAGLRHLADADSTIAPAPAAAQLSPGDAAPELCLGLGQVACSRTAQSTPEEDSKEEKLRSKPGAGGETIPLPGLHPFPKAPFLRPQLCLRL